MAKIRVGDFGNDIPTPSYARDVGRVKVGAGLAQLGQALQNMGAKKQAEAKEAERGQAYVVAARYESALEQKRTDLLDREARGELTVDQLDESWREETQLLREEAMNSFPEESRDQYLPLFELREIDQSGKFITQQRGRIQENKVRDLDTGLNANAQIALKDPERAIMLTDQLVDLSAPGASISSEKAGELKARFRDRAWENNLRNRLVDSKRISEVKDLRRSLDNLEKYPGMVPETRLQLKAYADSKKNALEAEYDASQRMLRAEAATNLNGITKDLMSGREIPVETVIGYGDYVKDLPDDIPQKREALIAQELHPRIRMMVAMKPTERAAMLNAEEAKLQGLAGKERLDGLVRVNLLREAATDIQRRNDNDPYGQLEAWSGMVVPPLDTDSDLIPQLGDRATWAARAQSLTGRNPGLLKPDERTVMAKGILGMTQEQQEVFFAGMRELPQRELVQQTFKDLAQAEPMVAYAGAYALIEARDAEKRDVGAMLLRGKKAIDNKALKMPDDTFFRKRFDDAVGGAFGSSVSARGASLDMVKNYYAAIVATSDKPVAGAGDQDAFDSAFKAVMGGDAPVTINKAQVFPPYGMKPDDFEQGFATSLDRALDASGLAVTADAREALHERAKPRQADGMGNYYLEWMGDWIVYPAGHRLAGQRVIVHVDPP